MQLKQRIKNSLFLQIILIFLAAHLTIVAVGFTVHKYLAGTSHHRNMDKNMVYYGLMLIEEMGFPPDTVKARQISDSLDIAMCFSSEDFSWTTETQNRMVLPSSLRDFNGNGNIFIAFTEDGFFLQNKTPAGQYLMLLKTNICHFPLTPLDVAN